MGAPTPGRASQPLLGTIALAVTLATIPSFSAVPGSSIAAAPQLQPAAVSSAITDPVIHACAEKNNGQLRIVGPGVSCRPSEVALSWNVQGVQGPPGAPGAPGPAGVSGLERVDFSSKSDSATKLKHAFARCPEGKHVVGGGANITIAGTALGAIALKKSNPDDQLNGWAATAEALEASPNWFVTAYALCANVAD